MRNILSKNPFTGVIRQEFDFISNEQLLQKVRRAEQAFEIQKKRTISERATMIGKLGKAISKRQKEISEIITFETGKPIKQSEGEVAKVITFCQHYAKHYEPLFPTNIKSDATKKTLIKYNPLGIVYFLVPFNFPFFLNFKGGIPNLLAGNCLLTRNADSTPFVGKFVEEVMCEAGFDSGEYQNVYTSHDQLDMIMKEDSVAGVSFTGSSRAGKAIAAKAGEHLKRSVMQLGGNDPFVVLLDADMSLAVKNAIIGRTRNAGQICFSPKRFIIVKEVYEKFKTQLIEGLGKVKYGDPTDPQTQISTLAREDLYTNLEKQLENLPEDYKIIWKRQDVKKPFFPITVIEAGQSVYDEEIFGPVYTLFMAQNEQHALKLANTGTYGLGASVYSAANGEEFIDQVRCGMGFVNSIVSSNYMFPSGGVGKSGYGRECGTQGYKSFVNVKVHYVD